MNLDKLYQVAARTDNLDESVVFYQDVLGATLMGKYDPPGIALFNFSGTRLILEKGASPAILYFWVDDIEAACEELKGSGVNFDAEPGVVFKDDTGFRCAVVRHQTIGVSAYDGGHIDDLAVLLPDHDFACGNAADKGAGEIQLDGDFPGQRQTWHYHLLLLPITARGLFIRLTNVMNKSLNALQFAQIISPWDPGFFELNQTNDALIPALQGRQRLVLSRFPESAPLYARHTTNPLETQTGS